MLKHSGQEGHSVSCFGVWDCRLYLNPEIAAELSCLEDLCKEQELRPRSLTNVVYLGSRQGLGLNEKPQARSLALGLAVHTGLWSSGSGRDAFYRVHLPCFSRLYQRPRGGDTVLGWQNRILSRKLEAVLLMETEA